MTRVTEEDLDDEMVVRKLTYQVDRTLQLLECLAVDEGESEPFVSVVESYSRQKVEVAAEQALTGWSLPKDTSCCNCGRNLVPYKSVTVRARRPLGLLTWFMDAWVCEDCDVALDPDPDSMDVIASAWITRWDAPDESRTMVLSDIAVEEASGTQYRSDIDMEVADGS
ncbi:hypothetical protein AArcSl_0655 [Halalkaliarchaeum desulfuricum]|uniref:Uncharacterized protein n=1 Tax=Halalkaliarchaeum desulfuricum TaxID=2055893 RepID=A0A343TGT3_9EURY|nr:hypothetical protein [Halalkaliarchaeum desulfuricum]AUX08305.1 hypothetical protein AArcSl_0655 [Halalkaliarchaeum desulfuricum]